MKGAIFDMDGTLLDSMQVWVHVGEQYLRNRGIEPEEGLGDVLFPMSMRDGAVYVKERYGLAGYFKQIFTCTEIGAGKERPDIYLAAAKALGTHPADTWVFEDALYAIKTAKAAGFYTVGFYDETSRNDQEAIAGLADCYVREIQSVPTQDCT